MKRTQLFFASSFCLAFFPVLFTAGCGGGGNDATFGGSAGISNGGFLGNVQGAGSQGVLPILGALVVAVRQNSPPVTRTTQTDANGDYVLSNLPLGSYSIGFSAAGFAPVPAQTVSSLSGFVESGSFTRLQPV